MDRSRMVPEAARKEWPSPSVRLQTWKPTRNCSWSWKATWGSEDDRGRMVQGSGAIQKNCPQPTGTACPRYVVLRCPRSASGSMLYIDRNVRLLSECLEHAIERLEEQLSLASFAHRRHHGSLEPLRKESTRHSPSAASCNHGMSRY